MFNPTIILLLGIFTLSLCTTGMANNHSVCNNCIRKRDVMKKAIVLSLQAQLQDVLGINASDPWPVKSDLPNGALEKFYKENPTALDELRQNNARVKRQTQNCKPGDNEKRCCRFPLTITFSELGPAFDYIFEPKSFEASYCSGECPLNFLTTNDHTHLIQLTRAAYACCIPTKMSPLTVLYHDKEGKIRTKLMLNMVADACECSA